jgi:hypothetical protein
MGAKWAEKPIESLANVAGEWRGNGDAVEGYGDPGRGRGKVGIIRYVFKEDGSYAYSWAEQVKSDRGQRPAGTVRLHGGKLEWKIPNGLPWTATLYEDKKGRRRLKGRREDGGTWTLKARHAPLTAKAEPLPVPTLAPPGAQATRTTPYRIAMLPIGGRTKCAYLRRPQQKIASDVRALVQDNDSLTLVYSHYDESLNKPPIKKPGRLWKGDASARMTPNTKLIYTLAQERNIDAIVMYFQPDLIGYCQDQMPPYPITIYLVDVRQRKTYFHKGHEKDVRAMTSQVLGDFLQSRPKVIQAKAGATRTTPYRVAVFPFSGKFARANCEDRDADITAMVNGLIEQDSSLLLAYSHYDKNLNNPRVRKPDKLWVGRKPNVGLVYTLGRERDVDVVVMYRGDSVRALYCSDEMPPFPITIHLIDVWQKKTYSRKGHEKDLRAMTSQVFTDFMQGRPK